MPSIISISPRIYAAKVLFDTDPELDGIYICADGQGFTREGVASAHARDLNGDRTDYSFIEPSDVDLAVSIGECTTLVEVDAITEGEEDIKKIVLECADTMKSNLREAQRVAEKIAYVDTATSVDDLNLLLHGEEDQTVIDAIVAKIIQLEE